MDSEDIQETACHLSQNFLYMKDKRLQINEIFVKPKALLIKVSKLQFVRTIIFLKGTFNVEQEMLLL